MIVKKCCDIAFLENTLLQQNKLSYLKNYNITNLFEKFWYKSVDMVEKVTYSKVARENKEGKFSRKIEEQKKKYPLIYQEWAAIANDVQKEVMAF